MLDTSTPATSLPLPSLATALAERIARNPDLTAVEDGSESLTYGELGVLAGRVAAALTACGIAAGDAVGMLGVRSWQATVTAAGILGAGAVCVPVDADYPSARASEMLGDAGVRLAVTLPGHAPLPPEAGGRFVEWYRYGELVRSGTAGPFPALPGSGRRSGEAAYVLYTSGTTGRPKPVLFPHRAVARLAMGPAPWAAGAGPGAKVLQTFGLSFDGSLFETWTTLVNGGCLVVADRRTLLDTEALYGTVRQKSITHAFLTTSLFHHTARSRPDAFAPLEMLLMGGEAMDPALTRAVCDAGRPRHLINGYGPTEGGIMATAHDVPRPPDDAAQVPIGRPVAGSTVLLLRPDGTPADPGDEGEIHIGGPGVALGYLNRPEETAAAFVAHGSGGSAELPGQLYRTGDRARWAGDGLLEFLGRTDRQVKVRGFRVELDAVEAQLRSLPGVAEAAVVVRTNDAIGKGLSAFVTPARGDRPPEPGSLRAEAGTRLPAHAVPAPITVLDRLPLTRNGKIDYTALARSAEEGVEAPEQANADAQDPLADIWADVLGTPVTGATDFFAAGGNSLLAAQAVTRTLTAHALPASRFDPLLRQLLTAPTLTAYRAAVHAAPAAPAAAALAHFEEDAQLVLPPRSPDSQRARPTLPLGTRGGEVLLTGATGFLGAFLLDRLVRTTNVTVHCLVRASDEDKALRRIEDAARRYLLPQPPADRLRAVPADLSQPDLGLPPGVAEHLANSVDLVLHNAAHVNFLYPYAQLRNTNVKAVRALVDLAAARRVPLHYVSTTAVFAGSGVGGVPEVDESTPLSHPELLSMGYPESKWVAERMLAQAAAQGLPVTIHRPYEITGDSRTGAWNTTTAICAVVDAVARLGAVPEVPLPLDLVPVDHVASAITRIAMQLPHLGGAVHLTNPRPAMLADMAERMRAAGHTVRTVPYGEWVDMLGEHVRDHPAAPIAPFLPLFVTPARGADFSVKEMYFDSVFPEIHRTRTDEIWPDWARSCPPVDAALLDLYLACLRGDGLLQSVAVSAKGPDAEAAPASGP
ncbi:non-ribosomal peptide synthetase [Streptomyces sp. AA1529]|uniref:non-ribosomal peptide synthetase n=1 Tax=Streptomyces sp. AA1529 TaxID=1203257 RepID=UPI003D760886